MTVTTIHPILENLKTSEINIQESKKALSFLEKLSFPTRKTEDWKYTKVSKIIKKKYKQSFASCGINPIEYINKDLDAINVFVIDGVYCTEHSDTNSLEGVFIENIGENNVNYNTLVNNEIEIFTAINTAYAVNGISISVQKNVEVDKPIHIININTEDAIIANTRTLIVLEQSSQLELVQSYFSKNVKDTFTNSVNEIIVKENANFTLTKLENEGEGSYLIALDQIKQLSDSTIQINTITKRQGFARNDVNVLVDGQNCATYLNGIYRPINKEHIDNHTRVDHLKPNCTSSEIYKGVLNDKSTAVFNGKVIVHVDAQKIEAYQKNNNVLISDQATMNAKPELEIFADDVKCSHGTTTGQFDKEAIFYLQARGISKATAKEMLVEAFTDEVYNEIKNKNVVEYLKEI